MKSMWYSIATMALLVAVAVAQDAPKKITRSAALSAVATKVEPQYPAIAKQVRVQGSVELEAEVAETGEVIKVEIVSGNAMLTGPSVQAVKRWKFKPFVEDGKPIKVLAPITLDFKL